MSSMGFREVLRTRSPSTNRSASNATTMLISYIVAAVESGSLDLDDTTSMDATTSCKICPSGKHKTSRCQKISNISSLIPTLKRNFDYWRNRQKDWNRQPVKRISIAITTRMAGRTGTVYRQITEMEPCQLTPATAKILTTVMLFTQVRLHQNKPVQKTKDERPNGCLCRYKAPLG